MYRTPDNAFTSALAINFPSPETIGEPTPLSVEGTPFTSLHYFTDLNADIKERIATIPRFDLDTGLGGVATFVMIAGGGEEYFEPSSLVWTATFMHELFHRHQIVQFRGFATSQDFENYPFTAENIALAILEDRALREAVTTGDADIRKTAARQFAALRMARLDTDNRVAHDNDQERIEGSARYIEHRMAGDDTRFFHHAGNYEWGLFGDPQQRQEMQVPVKQYFGFIRFYASGAAVLRTLDLLGVAGVAKSVQGGKSPAEVLIEHLGVTDSDVPQLVADARAAYDQDDTLMAAAEQAATTAASEESVFGEGAGGGAPEPIVLTKEQVQCLQDHGVGSGQVIPSEVHQKCIESGEFGESAGGVADEGIVLTEEQVQCLHDHGVASGQAIPREVHEECIRGSDE
ncbi:MAG: hypothetical protein OXH41_12190 [Chloroflexi bacterium]|nr:hypothetical protein [Chloroflexota bacterium]